MYGEGCIMIVQVVEISVTDNEMPIVYAATIRKVDESNKEPGVVMFEAFQTSDTTLTIQEVYRDHRSMSAHKQTAHYSEWRQIVDRTSAKDRTKKIVTECDDRQSITR